MQAWADNSIWIAVLLSTVCWWLVKKVWFQRLSLAIRLPLSVILSIMIMGALSTATSLLVHLLHMPEKSINLISETPQNALSYFAQTGNETAPLWLIALVIRVFDLSLYDLGLMKGRIVLHWVLGALFLSLLLFAFQILFL